MRKSEFETTALEPTTGLKARGANSRPALKSVDLARAAERDAWGSGHQTTLATSAEICGIGLHSGDPVRMVLKPAAAGSGIVFRRTDLADKGRTVSDVPARFDHVVDTTLCTVVGNEAGTMVGTIEHLMSALAALRVDNVLIEIDSSEVPVMDGSAAAFVEAIDGAKLVSLGQRRRAIRILKPVVIEDGVRRCALLPDDGFQLDFEIDFENKVIGRQRFCADLADDGFRSDICRARSFGMLKDAEALWAMGLAQGGSLDNLVVLDGETIMNEDGLRFPDEFVRHKLLDAVGDLALAGGPLIGRYEGVRSGHALNNQILRALFADETAWEFVEDQPDIAPVRGRVAEKAMPVAVSAD